MKNRSKIKNWIQSLKDKKHLEIAIAVVAVVLMLVLYFSTRKNTTVTAGANGSAGVSASDYCERTEKELTTALEAMKGVGKVNVVIHWESGVERIIAYATNSSGNSVSTTPTVVTSQGASAPIVLKEVYPKAVGVIIICQGGDSVAVKLDVMNAVAGLLDISQNKVNVYAMK